MARWSERRRTTAQRQPGDGLPSLRRRNPVAYWVLLFLAASLLLGPLMFVVQQLL